MKDYWEAYTAIQEGYDKYYEIILELLCELNKNAVTFEYPIKENFFWLGKNYMFEIKEVNFKSKKIGDCSNLMFYLMFKCDLFAREDNKYIKIETDTIVPHHIYHDNFILSEIVEKLEHMVYQKKLDESYPHTIKIVNKDIIITDPCYIRKRTDGIMVDNDNKDDIDYDSYDLIRKNGWDENDLTAEQVLATYKKHKELVNLLKSRKNKEPLSFEEEIQKAGINNYLTSTTLYGDWSCTTFNSDTKEPIGEFCADGGEVGVFLLEEVLKYNPDFNYHIEKPWTTTLIKNFTGEVSIIKRHNEGVYEEDTEFHKKGEKWEDDSIHVIGKGNVNFETAQTGF